MKDICVQCGLEMRVGQVGVAVVQLYMDPPEPYTLTYADTRECPNCGREVVCPSSAAPTIQHHDAKFTDEVAKALYLAEAGKLRIIEVYERVNMAPKVQCADCLYWAAERLLVGKCRESHTSTDNLRYLEGERLCAYYRPRKEA